MALSGRPEQADQQHDPGGTVGALLLQAARGLVAIWAAESLDEGRLEADLLYGEAAGLSRAQVIAAGRESPPPEARARFDALLRRRMAREPLAYILGRREFHGLTFEVGPGALIPRPETETLVEASLAAIREHPNARRIVRVADAGTGSGRPIETTRSSVSSPVEGAKIATSWPYSSKRSVSCWMCWLTPPGVSQS